MNKVYPGKGWEHVFPETGNTVIDISLKMDILKTLPQNEWGEVRLTVSKMRKPDERSGAQYTVYARTPDDTSSRA